MTPQVADVDYNVFTYQFNGLLWDEPVRFPPISLNSSMNLASPTP